jgi:type I restriction enzyme M protein
MAEERGGEVVPEEFGWGSLSGKDAEALHRHYSKSLKQLGRQDGMLGLIFHDAKNKIRDPTKLRVLVQDLIGQTDWTGMSDDVKGDAYEGCWRRTPRTQERGRSVLHAATPHQCHRGLCPTGSRRGRLRSGVRNGRVLTGPHDFIRQHHPDLKAAQRRRLQYEAIRGSELVREVARLATMNLLLHGVGDPTGKTELPISCEDSLANPVRKSVDVVLTNPPFGVKGSFFSTTDEGSAGEVVRKDFWVRTSNKQLNFLQHVYTMLKPGGRAAVVVPDNVLFEGAAAEEIRRRLLTTCDVHTLLRLPTGIFYAHGVKANVLFFDLLPAETNGAARARSCGFTICERGTNSRSSRTRSARATSPISSHATNPTIAASERRRLPEAKNFSDGGRSMCHGSSGGRRVAWISAGHPSHR